MQRLCVLCGTVAYLALPPSSPADVPEPVQDELKASRRAVMPLEAGWADPPRMARTRAWWWWLNGNVTTEALSRDLAEMQAKGLGGANIIDAGGADQRGNRQVPHGPDFASAEWRRLFLHALHEADRRGLEMGFNITSGWNLGGPGVQPQEAAKRLTWSEATVVGGRDIQSELSMPVTHAGFYRDVAVIAFPLPDTGNNTPSSAIAASSSQPGHPARHAIDGDQETFWVSGGVQPGEGPTAEQPQWLELCFDRPVAASRVVVQGRPGYGPKRCRLESASPAGGAERLAEFELKTDERKSVTFDRFTSERFRLVILDANDPKHPHAPRNVQIVAWALYDDDRSLIARDPAIARISDFEQKAYHKYPGGFTASEAWHLLETVEDKPGEPVCRAAGVVDVTNHMAADGTLHWDAPRGMWRVLRFGYTLSGARVSTHSENWGGWAIDYLERDAFDSYWQRVVAPILAEAGPLVGRSLKFLHTDSWELGPVNWTAKMPRQFHRLRGYPMTPYMPALAGYVVESREVSTRFLNDFRRTLADLIAENKYATFAEYAHRHGLGIHPESGGPHAAPIDALQCLARSDIPMGEFWARAETHRVQDFQRLFVKQAGCAAHIYGRRLVLAEAFTSIGPQWEQAPSDLKPVFDRVACEGLNLTMLHTFDCSPQAMGIPGQAYFAGTHINPNVTWWNQAGAFISYLNRCHFLLQQGLPVADVLYFYGENVPSFVRLKRDDPAGVLPGYDYDVINAEALLTRTTVDGQGRVALTDGTAYPLLVLPEHDAISLKTLQHVAKLVAAGATVVGRRPEKPFSLTGYPPADDEFRALADQVWGRVQKDTGMGRRFGRGRVFATTGLRARKVLETLGVEPDFTYATTGNDALLDYIHRTTDEAEIYFVANRRERPIEAEASFRVAGRQPELWDPVTGDRREAHAFRQREQRTIVPLRLPPNGSIFVLFRRAISPEASGPAGHNFDALQRVADVTGPWQVSFDPKWGGPESVRFERLIDWTSHPEAGIRYYSGTATYNTRFDFPGAPRGRDRRIMLDLGEVKDVAEVKLNDRTLGVVWTKPFRVEITDVVRPTDNRLVVHVINLWPNRIIGDQRAPPDRRYTRTNITKFKADSPLRPAGLLGPVTLLAP